MLIEIQGLKHVYNAKTPLARSALQEISVDIPQGQRVGIIGATGSGKSTLVQHIAGLLTPTAGLVRLDGVPAHESSARARIRRRRVRMAFQYPEDQIFERTVYREVASGLGSHRRRRGWRADAGTDPTDSRLSAGQIRDRVQWALRQVGLDPADSDIENRAPLTLSGGEMRRVALASVLSTKPEVLILDEPTAGLDTQGRRALTSSIQHWSGATTEELGQNTPGARGPTLIIVSHNLDHLAPLVDRILVLAQGCVVADGPTSAILGNPDLLDPAGLDAPPAVVLLRALCDRGWSVRTDITAIQETVAEIARAYHLREKS